MERDFRYNMRHIGDAFVDRLEHLGRCAKGPVRGVTLTYNIDGLKKEKEKLVVRMGQRMAAVRKANPTMPVSEDAILNGLFSKLDQIDARIDAYKAERKARLYPKG